MYLHKITLFFKESFVNEIFSYSKQSQLFNYLIMTKLCFQTSH